MDKSVDRGFRSEEAAEAFTATATTSYGCVHALLFLSLFLDEMGRSANQTEPFDNTDIILKGIGNVISCLPEILALPAHTTKQVWLNDPESESKVAALATMKGYISVDAGSLAIWNIISWTRFGLDIRNSNSFVAE